MMGRSSGPPGTGDRGKENPSTCGGSSVFLLSNPPPDANNIGIYLDKNLIPKDDVNGWSFGANVQTIVLNGGVCDKATSGTASTV